MKVTETLNEGLRRECRVVVSAEEIDKEVMDKLRDAQPDFEIQGFRRGMVPLPLLKKRYGEEIAVQAMQEKVQIALAERLEEVKERPAFRPDMKMVQQGWKPGQDVEVDMSYEVLPEIPQIDCKAIELERLVVEPSDAEVDEEVGKLAARLPDFKDRAEGAAAEEGDRVLMDVVQSIDGVPIGGGGKNVSVPAGVIAGGVEGGAEIIPGFAKRFVGVKVGEDKTFNMTYPADDPAEHLAGKEVEFACSVKAVQMTIASKIDDAFAKRMGFADITAFKQDVRKHLAEDYERSSWVVLKRSLLDKLDQAASFDVPPTMVQIESITISQQLWREKNPDMGEGAQTSVEPTEEHRRLAERRVRLGLLMAELGREAGIEITDSEFSEAVHREASQFPGQEREFIKALNENPEMRRQLEAPLYENKVATYILELATVTNKPVSKDVLEESLKELEESINGES